MDRRIAVGIVVLAVVASVAPVLAQQSASYKLTEFALNAGGNPSNGASAASSSWRIRLDAIGDSVLGAGTASASWHLDSGFVEVYAPPAEVQNVRWSGKGTINWDPEKSVGVYDVYRDIVGTLPGSFGSCFQSSITGETWTDASLPAAGTGWFYLVTARNRLGEEGTKGFRTGGTERPNPSPCP
jgi:hypothetical protein